MTFQQRHESIKRVVSIVKTDLERQALHTSLQEYVLYSLISIDSSLIVHDRYVDLPIDRHILNTMAEPELNKMYNIVMSDFFYTGSTRRCRKLCVRKLKHIMFKEHESYGS